MLRLLIFVLSAALIWSVYWAVGSAGATAAVERWLSERRAEGWLAEVDDVSTKGYPNRFDTTLTGVTLADPGTGLAWDAPFFQIFALSYKPGHIIAVWPNEQRLATPADKFDVKSSDMRASLVTRPESNLSLERLALSATDLSVLRTGTMQPAQLSALSLAAERIEQDQPVYRFGVSADGFAPSLDWRARIDPGGNLPETLDALSLDVTVEFDTIWDLSAIEEARPQPRRIVLRLAEARWGRLELQAAGELDVDETGTPRGDITIKARNWREILRLSVDSGVLPAGLGQSIEDGLGLVAQLAGNPKTLDIPLGFRNGRIFLGPVPIGPSPNLSLR
ncbi:MAG: DUF2125 domain-containing protein [Pseudomonadota bacterium]